MGTSRLPTLILMAGHAGTGKTTFSRHFLVRELEHSRSWAFLDKDTIGGVFTHALMELHCGDGFDRDSSVFASNVRPLEYKALHDTALENLSMGISCVACAPFGRECANRESFETYTKSFNGVANIKLVWSHVSNMDAYQRIQARNHPMDKYKLEHWDTYVARRYEPRWAQTHHNAFWLNSGQNDTAALEWLQTPDWSPSFTL